MSANDLRDTKGALAKARSHARRMETKHRQSPTPGNANRAAVAKEEVDRLEAKLEQHLKAFRNA